MASGESWILTDERKHALLKVFEWLESKGDEGGTMAELRDYEHSINLSGQRLETYLVRCPSWFQYNPSRNSYLISGEGRERYERLKNQPH